MRKGLTVGQALILAREPVVRSPGAPFEVKATTVNSVEPEDEPWPKVMKLLVRGSVGTYVA